MKPLLLAILILTQNTFAMADMETLVVTPTVRSEVDTPSRTKVSVSELFSSNYSDTTEELLSEDLNLVTNRAGGSGQSSFLSLRGAPTEFTEVSFENIPLVDPSSTSGTMDFSNFSGVFSGIELNHLSAQQLRFTAPNRHNRPVTEIGVGVNSKESSSFKLLKSGRDKKVNYSFTYEQQTLSDISAAHSKYDNPEVDGSSRSHGLVQLGYDLSSKESLKFTSFFQDAFTDADRGGGTGNDDPNYTVKNKYFLSALSYDRALANHILENWQISFLQSDRSDRNFSDNTSNEDLDSRYFGKRSGLQWSRKYIDKEYEQTLGIDGFREGTHFNYSSSIYGNQSIDEKSTNRFGAFVERKQNYESYFINGLARIDAVTHLGEQFSGYLQPGRRWGTNSSWVAWRHSFKTPTLYQLYAPDFGNRDLSTQAVDTFEVGTELKLTNSVKASLVLFQSNFSNRISFSQSSRYENITTSNAQGLETSVSWSPTGKDELNLQHHYVDSRNGEDNKILLRQALHRSGINWKHRWNHKLHSRVHIKHVGKRVDLDPNSFQRVNMPEYWLTSIETGWQFRKDARLLFSAENLFDRKYEEIKGFGTQPLTVWLGGVITL